MIEKNNLIIVVIQIDAQDCYRIFLFRKQAQLKRLVPSSKIPILF